MGSKSNAIFLNTWDLYTAVGLRILTAYAYFHFILFQRKYWYLSSSHHISPRFNSSPSTALFGSGRYISNLTLLSTLYCSGILIEVLKLVLIYLLLFTGTLGYTYKCIASLQYCELDFKYLYVLYTYCILNDELKCKSM